MSVLCRGTSSSSLVLKHQLLSELPVCGPLDPGGLAIFTSLKTPRPNPRTLSKSQFFRIPPVEQRPLPVVQWWFGKRTSPTRIWVLISETHLSVTCLVRFWLSCWQPCFVRGDPCWISCAGTGENEIQKAHLRK